MPDTRRPWPYHVEIGAEGYMRAPPRLMRQIGEPWYTRKSLPWFPDRRQSGAISEALFPPGSETPFTILDRSAGFGWSDVHVEPGAEVNFYAYTGAVDSGATGDGQGADCSVEGVTMLGPRMNTVTMTGGDGDLSGHFEMTVGGTRYLYVVFGTKMFRSSNGTTFSAVQANAADLPAALTGRPRVFQGTQSGARVYFPMGDATSFRLWDGDAATAFTVGAAGDNNELIDLVIGDDDAMHGLWLDTTAASQSYRVSKFHDGGSAPSWTAPIAVSDRADAARYLMYAHGRVYVGCDRSLKQLAVDRWSFEQTIATYQPDTNNFRWWTDWNDELWYTAQQGTYRITPNGADAVTLAQVGPETLPNNRTPIRGVVRAKAGDDYCLYHFIRTEGGVTYLLKYRKYDGGRRTAFHSILRIGTYDVNYAFVSNIGSQPRLYCGSANTTMRYFILPRNGFYPPSDANYEYCAKGYVFDTRQHGGLYFVTKALIAWTGRAEDLTSTQKIVPFYTRDGDAGAFTQYSTGELTADPGSRVGLLDPVSAAWWENRIRLERGATVTTTPKLLASTTSYALRPVAKGKFTIYVHIDDELTTRAGSRDRRSAYQIENDLIALDSTATLTTIRNKRGLSYDVLVDEVDVMHMNDEADESVEAIARITASEFQARGLGTHFALGGYTHNQLGNLTHDQIANLL